MLYQLSYSRVGSECSRAGRLLRAYRAPWLVVYSYP